MTYRSHGFLFQPVMTRRPCTFCTGSAVRALSTGVNSDGSRPTGIVKPYLAKFF